MKTSSPTEVIITEKEMTQYRYTQLKLEYHKRICDDIAANSSVDLNIISAHTWIPVVGVFAVVAGVIVYNLIR